jgi:hypothetical protein
VNKFNSIQWGEKRTAYRLLVGKPEGKRPLGRPKHRWADNIKMDLVRDWMGCCGLDILVQDRYRWRAFVTVVMNLQVP